MGHILVRKSANVTESHRLLTNPNPEATPASLLGSAGATGSTRAKEGTGAGTHGAPQGFPVSAALAQRRHEDV